MGDHASPLAVQLRQSTLRVARGADGPEPPRGVARRAQRGEPISRSARARPGDRSPRLRAQAGHEARPQDPAAGAARLAGVAGRPLRAHRGGIEPVRSDVLHVPGADPRAPGAYPDRRHPAGLQLQALHAPVLDDAPDPGSEHAVVARPIDAPPPVERGRGGRARALLPGVRREGRGRPPRHRHGGRCPRGGRAREGPRRAATAAAVRPGRRLGDPAQEPARGRRGRRGAPCARPLHPHRVRGPERDRPRRHDGLGAPILVRDRGPRTRWRGTGSWRDATTSRSGT